jgi:hypothetical protein
MMQDAERTISAKAGFSAVELHEGETHYHFSALKKGGVC